MEYIISEAPVTINDVTLIPVVQVYHSINGRTPESWITASKQPLAVIICDAKGVRALNTSSSEIPIGSLLEKIPGLDVTLAPYW